MKLPEKWKIMELSINEYFQNFRCDVQSYADNDFQLIAFMETVARELQETGFINGFIFCHNRAFTGMRIDGYWFNEDEEELDLFVADFGNRNELASLTRTDIASFFKRIKKFFEACIKQQLHKKLEHTSSDHDVAELVYRNSDAIQQVNFYLLSERKLSDKVNGIDNDKICGIPCTYHIWDISRLHRQHCSRGHKEPLDINFKEITGEGIPCLQACEGNGLYSSYLMAVPAELLAGLYGKFGARLLEQNVRCFLQHRGAVNKGIKKTILEEPQMFFAYNNGITATAQNVEVNADQVGLRVNSIRDLQIVNGGQTTASLYHAARKDKEVLSGIFVQMKLSVIDSGENEQIVSNISRYANTQNGINAADFFSNHPFHIKMEGFSRHLWAPPQQGMFKETHWFYERARGQYDDQRSGKTDREKKTFMADNPKAQVFSKTDLAKFENVWDEKIHWVNLGAQKNFAQYALRIGNEWESNPERFDRNYFYRIIARAMIFKTTEKLVSAQPWYNGGYRANIVAYSIAVISEICSRLEKSVDFLIIWNRQGVSSALSDAICVIAEWVNEYIINPPAGISNISEWAKKEQCWENILNDIDNIIEKIPKEFFSELISDGN